MKISQRGHGLVGTIVTLAVICLLAFAGYKVWQSRQAETNTSNQPETSQEQELDQTDAELDSTASEVDKSLDTTELDADIDSML